jgi:Flp pilus assembly protein protease CpaA
MTQIPNSAQLAFLLLILIAAVTDLRNRTIPNWLTGAGVVAGLIIAPIAALKGAGLGLLIQVPLFYFGFIGGGDVKLMAASGALLGPGNFLLLFLFSAILEGVFAAGAVLIRRGRVKGLPRAPFVAVAGLLLLVALR